MRNPFFTSLVSRSNASLILAGVAVLSLGGCASKEKLPSFYVLTPAATTSNAEAKPRGGMGVLVRSVEMPSYLTSTKIATRTAGNQINYATAERWAEPPPEGAARAIAESLSKRHGLRATTLTPGVKPASPRVDLRVRVDRYEGDDQGNVVLVAHWALYRGDEASPFIQRDARLVQSGWTYGDYPALANLLSADIDGLSDEIARAVR